MATVEKMNVHKALAELKILESRISSAISDATFCVANKATNNKISGISVKDYEGVIQGHWDKINDLITRKTAIKKAVQLSNATTEVEINGQKMTRVEAIEMKNHGLNFKKELLRKLKYQYTNAVNKIDSENREVEKRADNYITNLLGSRENAKGEEADAARKSFIENNQFVLLDPIKIREKIDALQAEIDAFMAEVDSVLSVSNSLTVIEVEY